jgi:iron complex transport system substrate-binding protein
MRIVSLVPSATEILFALDTDDAIVGVTHECDHPEAALEVPVMTRDVLQPGLTAAEVDRAVKELTQQGRAIYELDEEALRDAEPDLIVTQELCAVCAVSADDVRAVAGQLDPAPRVVTLDPHTLGEVLGDIRTVAQAIGAKDPAVDLVQALAGRIDAVRLAVRGAELVRVAALEWLDPIYSAGHWVPQLIAYAGGEDLLGEPGEPSGQRSWAEVAAVRPEVVVVTPCGYGTERGLAEAERHAARLAATGARRVVVADASAWFSRPGPRLVDGLEWLAHVLHPDRVPEPPAPVVELELPTRD